MVQTAQDKAVAQKDDLRQDKKEPAIARVDSALPARDGALTGLAPGKSMMDNLPNSSAVTNLMVQRMEAKKQLSMKDLKTAPSADEETVILNLKQDVLSADPSRMVRGLEGLLVRAAKPAAGGIAYLEKLEAQDALSDLLGEKTLPFDVRLAIFKVISALDSLPLAQAEKLVKADPEEALRNFSRFKECGQQTIINTSYLDIAFRTLGHEGKLPLLPVLIKESGLERYTDQGTSIGTFYGAAALAQVQDTGDLSAALMAVPEEYRKAALGSILFHSPGRYINFESPPLSSQPWAKLLLQRCLNDEITARNAVLSYDAYRSPQILRAALPAAMRDRDIKADLHWEKFDPEAKGIIESCLAVCAKNKELLKFIGGDNSRLSQLAGDPELLSLEKTARELLSRYGKKAGPSSKDLIASIEELPPQTRVKFMEKAVLLTRYIHRDGEEVNGETVTHAARMRRAAMQRYGDIGIFAGRSVLVAANQELLSNMQQKDGTRSASKVQIRSSGDAHRFGKKLLMDHIVGQAGDETLVTLHRPEPGDAGHSPEQVKKNILAQYVNTPPGKEGFTFVFDGHGSREGLYLTGGEADKLATKSKTDISISVEELAHAIIERNKRFPAPAAVERRDILVLDACFSHDFARDLLSHLEGRVPLPIIVTSAEYNQYGFSRLDSPWGGMFWENGMKMARPAEETGFGGKILNFMAGRQRTIPQPAAHKSVLRDLYDATNSSASNPCVFLPPEADPGTEKKAVSGSMQLTGVSYGDVYSQAV